MPTQEELRAEALHVEKLRRQISDLKTEGKTASAQMLAEFAKTQKAYLDRKIEFEKGRLGQQESGPLVAGMPPVKGPAATPVQSDKPADKPAAKPAEKPVEKAEVRKPAPSSVPVPELAKPKEKVSTPDVPAREDKSLAAAKPAKAAPTPEPAQAASPSDVRSSEVHSPVQKPAKSSGLWIIIAAIVGTAIGVVAWLYLR